MIADSASRSSDPSSGSEVQLDARLIEGVSTNASTHVTIQVLLVKVVPIKFVFAKRKRIFTLTFLTQ
jgi:hypothetical protein